MLLIITLRQQARTGNVLAELGPMISLLINSGLSKFIWPQNNFFFPLVTPANRTEIIIPQNIIWRTLKLEALQESL